MKKETVKGSLSECVSFINKDIEGIKNNIIKALDEGNASAHDRWLKNLREALSVKKEYDWQLMYSEYETDNHKEVSIWEQDSECNIRNHKTWKIVDEEIEDAKQEYDIKKRKGKDFESDFYGVLHDDSKFLLDVSLYPRGCGKTKTLKNVAKIRYNNVIVLIPSTQILSYENELNNKNTNTKIISVSKDLDSFRGISFSKDAILVCEEGFSINEILDMKYKHGINIQCALVNGVE